jgi:hypothetical protein
MPAPSRPTSRNPYLLFLEDHGTRVLSPEGEEVGLIQEVQEGSGHRTQWAEELRRLLPLGASVQICVGFSHLAIQCQETPSMPAKEARQVALRVVAAEHAAEPMLVGHAMDADAEARGGYVHWTAYLPAAHLTGWGSALAAAGLQWVQAAALPRVLLRALPAPGAPRDRVVLALAPQMGRLLFFRGPALVLQRAFRLAEGLSQEEILEQAIEETARTLQFYKQKFRGSVPGDLLVVGTPTLPEPLLRRLRATGLATSCSPETLDAVLTRGLALERSAQGLDLRPPHYQDASRRRTLRAALVLASAALLVAFIVGGGLVRTKEKYLEAEASRAEAELAKRRAATQERLRVISARMPLLRLRSAEARQARSTERISRLASALLSAPPGLDLEKVEIQQQPGPDGPLGFQVSGAALTGSSFSVGPLAAYLTDLQRLPGLALDPLQEVSVGDRMVVGEKAVSNRALTRFALSGRLR